MAMIKHHTGIEEMVGQLLERLKLAKEHVPQNSEFEKFINQINTEIVKITDILDSREQLDKELVGYIQLIARQINPWINLNPCYYKKAYHDLPQIATMTEVGEPSNTSYQMDEEVSKVQEFKDLLESLGIIESYCMKSLSMFPANTKLKKRLVIYWWYGLLGIEGSERLFSRLINKKVLIPVHRDHNKAIDHFTIEPTVYRWLISNSEGYGRIASMQGVEGTWQLLYGEPRGEQLEILLNLDQGYPHSRDIMDISSKHNNVGVIQLGRWCYTELEIHNEFGKTGSEVTKSIDHIEIDETDFLKKLNKKVRYLSLRGISRITELHESVGKLKDLVILDLRACHNLEILPQKPRSTLIQKLIRWKFSIESGWFKKLQVLDISECYLLTHMPKWVCELSNLVVLKGFVVGGLENKNQSCLLCDLSKLNNLEKLSIRIITNCNLGPEDFHGFNSLDSLLVLTIIWGQYNLYKEIPIYSLPKNLEKLDMRCYPEDDASKWMNPEELKKLKRLYIRGGNLSKIPCHDNWKVEILRLRFLKKLVPTNWNEVRSSFKYLKYVEYVGCHKPINFPNKEGSTWRNEE